MQLNFPNENNSIIKVIGVGGGGSNAVAHMFKKGIVGVDFAICNTDIQALEASDIPTKIQLGPSLTEGRGAGNKPEVGKQSCIESIDEVRQFLGHNTKMLFVTAGMGGGTGTGAAPIIAKAAKDMEILTVGIVTIPFKFEGMKRKKQALEGLELMKGNVDCILVISNDKLRKMFGDLTIEDAFSQADTILTTAAKGIAEIITLHGTINVDFEDVNTTMRNSGVALMGSATAEGDDRAKRATEMVLNSPLLEDNDIRGAKQILLNVTSASGVKACTMDELDEITEFILDEAGAGIDIIWGHGTDDSLNDKINITLIATGFQETGFKERKIASRPKKVGLDDDENIARVMSNEAPLEIANEAVVFDFEQDDVRNTIEELGISNRNIYNNDPIISMEKPEMDPEERMRRDKERARKEYVRISSSKPLDNPQIISELEKIPAFERQNISLDDVSYSNERGSVSNVRISVDDDFDLDNLSRNNSFLHDNVD